MTKGIQHGPTLTIDDGAIIKRGMALALALALWSCAPSWAAPAGGAERGERNGRASSESASGTQIEVTEGDVVGIGIVSEWGISDGPDPVNGRHGFRFFGLGKECSMVQLGKCNYTCEQRASSTARQLQAVACEVNYVPANYYEINPQMNEALSCVCGMSRPNPSRIADSY